MPQIAILVVVVVVFFFFVGGSGLNTTRNLSFLPCGVYTNADQCITLKHIAMERVIKALITWDALMERSADWRNNEDC